MLTATGRRSSGPRQAWSDWGVWNASPPPSLSPRPSGRSAPRPRARRRAQRRSRRGPGWGGRSGPSPAWRVFVWYNWCRVHRTLGGTPAQAAGLANGVWHGLDRRADRRFKLRHHPDTRRLMVMAAASWSSTSLPRPLPHLHRHRHRPMPHRPIPRPRRTHRRPRLQHRHPWPPRPPGDRRHFLPHAAHPRAPGLAARDRCLPAHRRRRSGQRKGQQDKSQRPPRAQTHQTAKTAAPAKLHQAKRSPHDAAVEYSPLISHTHPCGRVGHQENWMTLR